MQLHPIGKTVSTWEVGSTSAYRFRLFGVIPFGTHTIHIVRFDPDGISSCEENGHVPVWNHDITLKAVDAKHTRYTDRVEIQAGWKTVFIWLWANVFYAHRQRKWIRLSPGKMQAFRLLPTTLVGWILGLVFQSSFGDRFMYRHSMKAPDEKRQLHEQLYRWLE